MLPVTIENPTRLACMELAKLISPASKLEVRPIRDLEELQRLHAIDADAYQECSLTFDSFRRWWERYPEGITSVFAGDETIAAIGLWPISKEQAEAFVAGQIRESDLDPVLLSECSEDNPQHVWYASGIVLKEELRGTIKSNPLKLLLSAAIGNWTESNRVAYPLRVLALGEYVEGQNILRGFDFEKIIDGTDLPDGCDMYCLERETEEAIDYIFKKKKL